MLETTLVALQDIMLDKVLDEVGRKRRKILCSEFSKIMQQVTKNLTILFVSLVTSYNLIKQNIYIFVSLVPNYSFTICF
jgi:hypothetical protein